MSLPPTEQAARGHVRERGGFTLVELLVSMSVLVLILVITAQLVGKASTISAASSKVFDAAAMARIVFDRLGDDLAGASLTGGQTILYYGGLTGGNIDPVQNSSFGFVCKSRAKRLVYNDAGSVPSRDVRGTVVGYKIRPTAITLRVGSTVNIPLINRGDAEFTFQNSGNIANTGKYVFNPWDFFSVGTTAGDTSLPTDLSAATGDSSLLTWQNYGDGVLRLHVSFVLDDGRIVQNPKATGLNAYYKDFKVKSGYGDCVPVAFSAATTADTNKRYVVGMIVGVVVLDRNTLNTRIAQLPTLASDLATTLKRPVNDGETPLVVWQTNLGNVASLPVRQNLHFYQRYYAMNF